MTPAEHREIERNLQRAWEDGFRVGGSIWAIFILGLWGLRELIF